MKNILKCLFVFTLLVSCDENLDINTDPNTPTDVDKGFVLTAAEGSLATVMGGELTNLGGFFAQYHTQSPGASQYLNIDSYNMNTDYSNRLWDELYAGCLNDLNYVLLKSEEEGETGSFLIATLLRTYTFQVLTDLYGDIPYSEAVKGSENITPKADLGQDIYLALIAEINSAISKYNSNPVDGTLATQDAIYDADIQDWLKFANTLKLKLYLRMSYTDQANPSAVNALLADDNFLTKDAMFAVYEDAQNKANPFYDVQLDRIGDVNNIASSSLLQFYDAHADPRMDKVYRKDDSDVFSSLDQGDRASFVGNQARNYSRPNIIATSPVYLMTISESNFLQAEALIRYAAGAGAKAKYDNGISESFQLYGLAAGLATPFTAASGAYEYVSSPIVETAIRQVMIQKWASLAYINNIEAFFESNRTQYPETKTLSTADYTVGNFIVSENSVLPGGQTPNTIFYPDSEVSRNSKITQKSSLTEKIWWDQK